MCRLFGRLIEWSGDDDDEMIGVDKSVEIGGGGGGSDGCQIPEWGLKLCSNTCKTTKRSRFHKTLHKRNRHRF